MNTLPQGHATIQNESTGGLAYAAKRRGLLTDRWLSRIPLFTVTYLAKISVPPFASMGVTVGIPLVFATAIVGILIKRLIFDQRRTVAFFMLAATLLLIQAFAGNQFSVPSLALFFVLYVPFIFRLRSPPNPSKMTRYFINTCIFIGVCGICQYVAQFIIGPIWAFPVDNFVPMPYLMALYNNQAVLEYGSTTVRSNGIFMLEPSFFSQLLALGIVVEIATEKRLWIIGVLGVAIVVSHSGTGLMLLGACLAYNAFVKKRWEILVGIAVVGILIGLAELAGAGSTFENLFARVAEFGQPGSSGSMRFVEGFYMFEEFLWNEPIRAFFGYGAGTFVKYLAHSNYFATEMFLFKLVFEFGLFGALAFFSFLGYCLITAEGVKGVKIGIAMVMFMGGLYTPLGHCLAFCLLIWIDVSSKKVSAS